MKNFEYIAIFALFAAAIFCVLHFLRRLKSYHFYRLCLKAILKKQQTKCGDAYLSSYYLLKMVKKLSASFEKEAKSALIYLSVGKSNKAQAYFIRRKDLLSAFSLMAMFEPEKALEEMEKAIQQNPKNQGLLAELATLYHLLGDKAKCKMALENIASPKPAYVKARKAYLETYVNLLDGDMLSASANCSLAIKNFRREQAHYEEGRAYLLMGIIYRTAVVADVSELMFRAAKDIFEQIKATSEKAKVLANFGMLMATQRRFEEAMSYYEEAEDIVTKLNRQQAKAEINNQQGLMCLMKDDLEAATLFSTKALEQHQKIENTDGIALSKEILGNIAWQKKDFCEALRYAEEAKNLYKKRQNISAYLENKYLMALSLFEQDNNEEAERLLREIIGTADEQRTNFHTANAYNLLGLIYLKAGDLQRAKGLFQQSLGLEQISNRLGGIATDYANISEIEYRCGNIEQSRKTLETAIEYAEANGDEELVAMLRARMRV